MLKVQAVLHDGSVALEFMTDDTVEAEEMRVQFLDLTARPRSEFWKSRDGLQCEADVCKRSRTENSKARSMTTPCSR